MPGGIDHRDDVIEAIRAIRLDDVIAVIVGDLREGSSPSRALDPVLAALGAGRNERHSAR